MIIYPAIDILGGKCVRLTQGKYDSSTVYADNPCDMAKKWEKSGAKFLHTVDLDGARLGKPVNLKAISGIVKSVNIPVQTGGGIRTMEDIETLLGIGVSRVILGTSAVNNRQLVCDAVEKYGDKIAVGIDAKDNMVAVSGWETVSTFTAIELAAAMADIGVKTIIYTDISTDGMLSGPNLSAMRKMAEAVSCDIIASGGVSCAKDCFDLAKTGVAGVIIGKALYTDRLKPEEVLCLQNE